MFLEFEISLSLSQLSHIVRNLILNSIAVVLELLHLLPLTFLLSNFIFQSLDVLEFLLSSRAQFIDLILQHSVLHQS